MKNKNKKLFRLMFILTMTFSLILSSAVTASAYTSSYIWINGIKLNSGDWLENGQTEANTGSFHNAEYADGVLTLNNALIENVYKGAVASSGIYCSGDLQLILIGNNTVKTPNVTSSRNEGITVSGKTTVSGNGNLSISNGLSDAGYNTAFSAHDITIGDSVNITATSNLSGTYGRSTAFSADNMIVTDNAVVTVSPAGDEQSSNYGISAKTLTIEKFANVTSNCQDCGSMSYGISAVNGITISDNATVTSKPGNGANFGYGFSTNADITIKGNAVVNAYGGNDASFSYGLFSYKNVYISDTAAVKAVGGTECTNSYGIKASTLTSIKNTATLEASGESSALAAAPDLTGYVNAEAMVNTLVTAEGAYKWNKTDNLGGADTFKYVKLYSGENDITLVGTEIVNENELKIEVQVVIKRDNPNTACVVCIPVFEKGSSLAGKMLGLEIINIPADGNANVVKNITLQIPKPAENNCSLEYYLLDATGVPIQDFKTLDITY